MPPWQSVSNQSNHQEVFGADIFLHQITISKRKKTPPGSTANESGNNTFFPSNLWLHHIQYGEQLLSNVVMTSRKKPY